MDIRIGSKKFLSRIKGYGLEDWQVKSAYYLELSPKGLHIEAADYEGFFYAIQSAYMMRFVSPEIQCCRILDWPRFRHRGMMLDVSRNFQPVEFVKRQLDMMALLKMNKFHFHLVDHPGWRIQIDKYPLLTGFSAWRTKDDWEDWIKDGQRFLDRNDPAARGGFYTKKDIAEIIAYAADRQIEVIPEIEMPGHNYESIAAYPFLSCMDPDGKDHLKGVHELCPGNEQVYEFLENVLTEVFEMFPSKYIHIGGDEAGKGNWAKCPVCQAKMKAEGLGNVEELQSYLVKRMEKDVQASMKEYRYRGEGMRMTRIGGKKAYGIRYRYKAQDVNMVGDSYVMQYKKTYYYFHCYMREELEKDSVPVWEEILSSVKLP